MSLGLFAQNFDLLKTNFNKSLNMEKKGDYTNSIKTIKNIYDENSYEINLRLGWLNYQTGNFAESSVYYNRAIKLMPYSEEAKFGLVLPKAALGKWDEVKNLYEQIITNSPNNTTANYRLGLIYYGRKDYAKSLKYFKKVVNLYPFNYDGLLMYAWANFQTGKMREAKILFNKVLLISQDDKSALEGLSLIK
ncbi:MAG: tetratricopeptide repeat protein [Bacteroidetes bacterium]|nr:tetratricopeptide repeat protein [Bacteroidota bacterium]